MMVSVSLVTKASMVARSERLLASAGKIEKFTVMSVVVTLVILVSISAV